MSELCRRWWHSFEEDHDHIRVYRPDGFDFPPARGRRGIELQTDGTCTEFGLGRGDAPEPTTGTWTADDNLERLDISDPAGSTRTLRLVHLGPDRLELDPRDDQ